MFCPNCGKKTSDTTNFCTHCGGSLKGIKNENINSGAQKNSKIYGLNRGQFWVVRAVIWVLVLTFWILAGNSYDNGATYFIFSIILLGAYVFYEIGWQNTNKKSNPKPKAVKNELNEEEKQYIKQWSWGASMIGFIWALYSKVGWYSVLFFAGNLLFAGAESDDTSVVILFWILGVVALIIFGKIGRRLAWRRTSINDFSEFKRKQENADKYGLIVFIITVLILVVQFFNVYSNDEFDDQLLTDTASEMNTSLPMMIDSETRLDSTAGVNNTFIYKYTFVNYQKEALEIEEVKNTLLPKIKSGVCTTPELKIFRDNKVLMRYNYYDADGDFIFSIEADTKDCY